MAIDFNAAMRAYSAALKPVTASEAGGVDPAAAASGGGFADLLAKTVQDTVAATQAGEAAMMTGAAGQGDLVNVVTAIASAEVSLETMTALRDRVISAYQEIMRMPI